MYEVFERILKERKLKVSDVSKATGITPSTFSDWKAGKYTPKYDKLQKIADYLQVSLDYLICGYEAKYNVTDEEFMIIMEYREAPEYVKQAILDLLHVEMDVVMDAKKDALDA